MATNPNMQLRQIERSKQLAQALQAMSMQSGPVAHPYQGLAKLAQAWAGTRANMKLNKREKEVEKEKQDALIAALGPQFKDVLVPGEVQQSDVPQNLQQKAPWDIQGQSLPNSPIPAEPRVELNQLSKTMTSAGLPQDQINQLMQLDPSLRENVMASVLQQQMLVGKGLTSAQLRQVQPTDPYVNVGVRQVAMPGQQPFDAQIVRAKDGSGMGTLDASGNMVPIDSRYLSEPIDRTESGPPGAFTDAQVGNIQTKIAEQTASFNTFAQGTEYLLKIVRETPGANTLTAQLVNIGDRVVQEAKAMSRIAGVSFEAGDDAWNIGRYEGLFKDMNLAAASPRVKNGFLAMAIQRAMASGLGTGRALSDYDIKNQLRTLGDNQSNPEIMAEVFADSYEYLRMYTANQYSAYSQVDPSLIQPDLYTPSYVKITPVEQLEGWDTLSQEQQQLLKQNHPNGYRQR